MIVRESDWWLLKHSFIQSPVSYTSFSPEVNALAFVRSCKANVSRRKCQAAILRI